MRNVISYCVTCKQKTLHYRDQMFGCYVCTECETVFDEREVERETTSSASGGFKSNRRSQVRVLPRSRRPQRRAVLLSDDVLRTTSSESDS